MPTRSIRPLIAAGLLASLVAACQAPGFMGLNGDSTIPGLGLESYTLARVPIRVVLPASLVPGSREGDRREVPAEGATVYVALDPNTTALTDSEGIAPLTIPVNGVQLIRAEVRTASGTLVLEGMMGLPFSREREAAGGPNTVSVPSMRELNEPLTLSLASTLVAAHLQERFTVEQIRYLDPMLVLTATREVAQSLKATSNGYQVASLPDLTDLEDVQRVARELSSRHEKVREALRGLSATRVPDLTATPSATASALPDATASVEASSSVPTAGVELFPLKGGASTAFVLEDDDGQSLGTVRRTITKITRKSDGSLAYGRLVETVGDETRQSRFLLKLQGHQVKLSMPFRPELTYPLPLRDGEEWVAAPGFTAKTTFYPADEATPAQWLITVTGSLKGKPVEWTEWYQPQLGLTAFRWGNDADAPQARMIPPSE